MLYRSASYLLLSASLLLGSGCGGDGGATTSDRPSRDEDTVDDGKRDESRKRQDRDDPTPGECACDPNEICHPETGECVSLAEALPEGELYGEVNLERYTWVDQEKTRGRIWAWFFVYEDRPSSNLQEYYTEDNELCLVMDGYSPQPKWPKGPKLDAGELTVTVDGGDEPIVVESYTNSGEVDYWLKDGHPPTDNGGMFYEENLPLDATFTIEAAGGVDIGAFTFDAGIMPEAFEIEREAEMTDDYEMTVRWDPPQPAATMEISIGWGGETGLTCWVRDDGEAKIPTAVGNYVELKRVTARLATVDADGKDLRLLVRGENSRARSLCTRDCGGSSRSP